jgi:hypothetical protein
MCLPGIEQANLISVADGGLSIVVDSVTSFHRVPIYQRYRWELMNTQNRWVASHSHTNVGPDRDLVVSEHLDVFVSRDAEYQSRRFTASSSLSGEDSSSSKTPYISNWRDYSAKFRLPYSSMVSYQPYNDR